MCLSCEIHDKWPPFIEFVIWFLLQGVSVGNHFAVWCVLQSHVIDITESTYRNATQQNITTTAMVPVTTSSMGNSSQTMGNSQQTYGPPSLRPIIPLTLFAGSTGPPSVTMNQSHLILHQTAEQQWATLIDFRAILLIFCVVGAILYILHTIMLLPNVVQSCRVSDPISLKDTGNVYFRNHLKMHSVMLIVETLAFDIPVGCLTMELLSLIWEGPLTEDNDLASSKIILALSLSGLAFIALYKGMMPLFLWIGNPFCFPCIPLRLLIVFPGGLIAVVMTFAPVMGVVKNRLLQFAPEVIKGEIEGLAQTFFSIGMIFWIIFLIALLVGSCCWYKVCREGAEGDVCSIFC